MEDITTVREMIEILQGYPPDAKLMIGVCKYPEEMPPNQWLDWEGSEVIHEIDISLQDDGKLVILGCELTDYSKERHYAGG